jgi:sulfatase modifying factor 1
MTISSLNRMILMAAMILAAGIAQADIMIDLAPVGNINNAADTTTGRGAVGYDYGISKFDVTAGQYAAFLTAVAATSDPYGLYNSNMATTIYGSQITKSGGVYTASLPNQPVNYVSWGDAARFCNWMSNGHPTGTEGSGTTETGSYTLNGWTDYAHLMTVTRNAGASYVIPTENELYKAAYYDPNKGGSGVGGYWLYPTKSDTAPSNALSSTDTNNANYSYALNSSPYTTDAGFFAGSPSAYGTFDQGGDVWNWDETTISGYRGARGGAFNLSSSNLASSLRVSLNPTTESFNIGFRVANVPEPGSITMLVGIALTALLWWRKHA